MLMRATAPTSARLPVAGAPCPVWPQPTLALALRQLPQLPPLLPLLLLMLQLPPPAAAVAAVAATVISVQN